MKKIGIVILILGLVVVGGYFWVKSKKWADPKGTEKAVAELNLQKYDFDSLKARGGVVSEITIGGPIKAVEDRRKAAKLKYAANFVTKEIFFESEGRKISGMMNYYPERNSLSKVIIMIRGYADKEGYYTGSGTWRVADKLAEAGYATISIDFLGYANSEDESTDIMEARFAKVNQVMDLIESVKQLPWVDKNNIGIWAHSNGGQIALSTLEVLGKNYPTVLWAPMTNPFPQSILDTSEDSTSSANDAQKEILHFEKNYDPRRYAFENYYEWVGAPILIQQGTKDVWCKVEWQQKVVTSLNSLGKQAKLSVYEGDDHNLSKDWQAAVNEDLGFFEKKLK